MGNADSITRLVFKNRDRNVLSYFPSNTETEAKCIVLGKAVSNTRLVFKNRDRIAMGCFLSSDATPGSVSRPVRDNVFHCHPVLENIPVTPLERRSMRMDRTKDQKSFQVPTFFTVTFLLPCLQPMTALPTM